MFSRRLRDVKTFHQGSNVQWKIERMLRHSIKAAMFSGRLRDVKTFRQGSNVQ